MPKTWQPRYISVDCEFDGPAPGKYSLVAFAAVTVDSPYSEFFIEEGIKPVTENFLSQNMKICEQGGFWRGILKREGADPEVAMAQFAVWLSEICRPNEYPLLVEYPGSIDFEWLHYYMVNFFNDAPPFGWSSLSIRAYYMGAMGCSWEEASSKNWPEELRPDPEKFPHTHNPLDDAREQAEMFRLVRAYVESK